MTAMALSEIEVEILKTEGLTSWTKTIRRLVVTKGWEFSWTEWDGSSSKLTLQDKTEEEAYEHARTMGWTEPRWWQWYRRSEDNYVINF